MHIVADCDRFMLTLLSFPLAHALQDGGQMPRPGFAPRHPLARCCAAVTDEAIENDTTVGATCQGNWRWAAHRTSIAVLPLSVGWGSVPCAEQPGAALFATFDQ